ncbi:hypothetical protein M0R01_02625 [bacterium]|nr:hypothetical protein [bacterium]
MNSKKLSGAIHVCDFAEIINLESSALDTLVNGKSSINFYEAMEIINQEVKFSDERAKAEIMLLNVILGKRTKNLEK